MCKPTYKDLVLLRPCRGDNDPYYADANAVGLACIGVTMSGNDHGDKTRSLSSGLTADHAVTTAIENLYEGITIAVIQVSAWGGFVSRKCERKGECLGGLRSS